jgi:hypothetical protein
VRVIEFVLLPGAGAVFRPVHSFGDQMTEVHLAAGRTIRFLERRLIWVSGRLRSLPGDPNGRQPLYLLENASVEPAARTDIGRYFR